MKQERMHWDKVDEENKHYSLGSSDNDKVTEGTP